MEHIVVDVIIAVGIVALAYGFAHERSIVKFEDRVWRCMKCGVRRALGQFNRIK